jgi:hypothetical protein
VKDQDKRTLPHVTDEYSIIPNSFFPNVGLPGKTLELTLNRVISGASLRDVAAYFTLLDRTYGRMSPLGLRRYSRRLEEQLRITQVRHGSLELVLAKILENSSQATPLILLFLLLKYLPQILKAVSEGYLNYEEARLVRKRREDLEIRNASMPKSLKPEKTLETPPRKGLTDLVEEIIAHEPNLKGATEETKKEILEAFEEFAQHDHLLHQAAERFSVKHVKEIRIRVVPQSGSGSTNYRRHIQTRKKDEKEGDKVKQYTLVKSS